MPQITPINGPMGQQVDTGAQSTTQKDARARAIAKLTEASTTNNAQTPPVQNPSQISPEEFTQLQAQQRSEGQNSVNESPSQEPAKQTQEAAKTEEPALSSQYAILARKEKQFRQQVAAERAKVAAERAEVEKAKAEIAAKDAEYKQNYIPKSRLGSPEEAVQALLDAGISYDQITQTMLQQGITEINPAVKQALDKMEAQNQLLRDELKQFRDGAQQSQDQQYKEAVRQITHEANSLITHDPSFEAIRETGSVKDVVDLIEKTFKEDGVLLTVEEAAKEVEDHLVEQLSNYARKIKKLQQKSNPVQPAQSQQSTTQNKQATQQQQPQAKTLTNSMATGKPLTARQRAMLAFENKLNK